MSVRETMLNKIFRPSYGVTWPQKDIDTNKIVSLLMVLKDENRLLFRERFVLGSETHTAVDHVSVFKINGFFYEKLIQHNSGVVLFIYLISMG